MSSAIAMGLALMWCTMNAQSVRYNSQSAKASRRTA